MLYIVLFFFVCAIFFAIGAWIQSYGHDTLGCISFAIGLVAAVVFISMLWTAFESSIGIKGKIAEKQAQYESLVYQLENGLYENGDSGKKELYDQITEWNKEVAKGKILQHDIFQGAFYPNIYDSLEVIELK